jgi:hypothetical protein
MILYCQIKNGKIIPEYSTDYEKLGKIKPNQTYKIEIKQPRNLGYHRKFFALLNLAFQNQDNFNNMDEMRAWLIMKAGFYKRVVTPSGEMFQPESISFSQMDELKFNELYGRVMDQICLWLDLSGEDIQNEIANFL